MVFTDGSSEPRIRATSSLAAAKAAFCIRGDNECDTGWPSSTTSVAVLRLVLEEVLVVRREVVVLVVRLAHEVEVVDLRGVRGRLERRGPGIVDRRRRQAVVHA